MAQEFSRSHRVAQEIKKEISVIFQRDIQDPRISMVTISSVEISRDLAYANIYFNLLKVLSNNHNPKVVSSTISALKGANGYIRVLLGNTMRLRIVPELLFIYDKSLESGMNISRILSNIMQVDTERRFKSGSKERN